MHLYCIFLYPNKASSYDYPKLFIVMIALCRNNDHVIRRSFHFGIAQVLLRLSYRGDHDWFCFGFFLITLLGL